MTVVWVLTTSTFSFATTFTTKLVEVLGFGFDPGYDFVGLDLCDDFLLHQSSKSGFKVAPYTTVLFG